MFLIVSQRTSTALDQEHTKKLEHLQHLDHFAADITGISDFSAKDDKDHRADQTVADQIQSRLEN